jgi:hypothetical protein
MPTERIRNFIDDTFNKLEERDILFSAFEVYDSLETKDNITVHEIEPIVITAKNKTYGIWQIGADFLWRLAIKHEVAREAIRSLITSKKVNERFQIMACIRHDSPISFAKEIILVGIADKRGRRVREKAAQAFNELNLKELIPIFEDALEIETNETTKWHIKLYLYLLRDGYILEERESGLNLVYPTKDGIRWQGVKPEEVETEEMIKNIIKQGYNRP